MLDRLLLTLDRAEWFCSVKHLETLNKEDQVMGFELETRYKKSPFVHVVQDGDFAVIWHSLFGYPKIVSIETLEFLESFSEPTAIRSRLGDKLSEEDREAIEELLRCYFLVPEEFDDRAFLEEKMRMREAAEFIIQKGFNVLMLENDQGPIDDNSDRIVREIQKLLQKKGGNS